MSEQAQDRAEVKHWEDFGKWLVQLRRDHGLTQQAVADKTSVSTQNLVSLEHGGYKRYADGPWILPNPRDDTLEALAKLYDVDAAEMFSRVGHYNDRPQTRSSLRRVSRRRVERSDRLAEVERQNAEQEERIRALEELVARYGLNAEPPQAEPRRRRAPG
jgi:transcriptional regulator with XRE-family HTH domain